MRYVVYDFETCSECDLLKRGAWVYASDFSTRILCLGYKLVIDGKPERTRVLSERQLMALDVQFMELVRDPTVIFVAHNAGFEQAIWKFQMEPMGWLPLSAARHHDTMAVAAMKALPLGLDKLTQALELPVRKDMDGHRLMMKMCKPNLKGEWEHSDDNMKRLFEYNVGDCDAQYASYIATKGLGSSERQVWVLDQKINQRGIRIDRAFVHACQSVLEQVRVPMTARFRELTGGINPTQREKILNWTNAQGVAMGNMKKATLDAVLDPDDEFGIEEIAEPLPYHVHEVLTLRRSLASSSVAKLQRMLDCTAPDGRVRYTMQYHGARTGRWAGRLIQIQNYPRGEIQERQGLTPEILADAILTRDLGTVEALWGPDIFSAVISSLRSCIVSAEGNVLVVGDYAAVEARNVLALAGQHDKVAMMHSGVDVYCEMGSSIFKKPVNKKDNPRERHIGKGAVLGCLTGDTLVLTHNGWKPLSAVTEQDDVWDGLNFVTHKGLVFRGCREVIDLSGLRLTPDHLVFTGEQWNRAEHVETVNLSRALGYAKASLSSAGMPIEAMASLQDWSVNVHATSDLILLTSTISGAAGVRDVINALRDKALKASKRSIGVIKTFARIKNTGRVYSTVFPQSIAAVSTPKQNIFNITEVEAFNCSLNGKVAETAGTQRQAKAAGNSWLTWFPSPDGATPLWKSTVLIVTGITNRVISVLQRRLRMPPINAQSPHSKVKLHDYEAVYDLAHAGPMNRFTVLTDLGPIIVHNCGYGLGAVGFRAKQAPGESIDLAFAAVDAYRKDFAPMVPKLWYGLYQASVDAVWCSHAKTYDFAGIEFRKEGDFLSMKIPSGRKIWYHKPEREKTVWLGEEKPAWSFMSYQGKKVRRHLAWHGGVTADCVQGTSRDLIAHALINCERENLPVVFTAHDEIVAETKDRPGLAEMLKQIMEDIPAWAHERKFLITAECNVMGRYRK